MASPDESTTASLQAVRSDNDPDATSICLSGWVGPRDAAQLGEQLRQILEAQEPDLVVCDVGALIDPDVAALDAICRLRLAARRAGCGLQLRNASSELQALLDLTGLRDVVPPTPRSGLEAQRQPE